MVDSHDSQDKQSPLPDKGKGSFALPPTTSTPAPGSAVPTPGGAVPTPGGAVPTLGGAVPTPGSAVPTPGGAVPTPGSAVPTPGGATPPPGSAAVAVPGNVAPEPDSARSERNPNNVNSDIPREKTAPKNTQFSLRHRLARPLSRVQWLVSAGVSFAVLVVIAALMVVTAKWLTSLEPFQDFMRDYPGSYDLPAGAPIGIPTWLGWQHFFNMFFLVMIIRTGIQLKRERRPKAFWTPKHGGKKISINLWIHYFMDTFWIVNGAVFYIMLCVTGQWMRIVPTSWAVFPNALSAALQFLSLNWPTESSWANYNSLQQLAYFAVVFIAAPLSIVSGFRISSFWPKNNQTLDRLIPISVARKTHFPVMVFFLAFTLVHTFFVFATDALRNLNHMYAAQDTETWTGFWWFVASLVVIAIGLVLTRPSLIAPLARMFGKVSSR